MTTISRVNSERTDADPGHASESFESLLRGLSDGSPYRPEPTSYDFVARQEKTPHGASGKAKQRRADHGEAPPPQHHKKHKSQENQRDHIVRSGETLSGIARRHGLSMRQLYGANPQFDPRKHDGAADSRRAERGTWDSDYIRPGEVIHLRERRDAAAPPPTQSKPAVSGPPTALEPKALPDRRPAAEQSAPHPPSAPQPAPPPRQLPTAQHEDDAKPPSTSPFNTFFLPTKAAIGGETEYKAGTREVSPNSYFKLGFLLNPGAPAENAWYLNVKGKFTPKEKVPLPSLPAIETVPAPAASFAQRAWDGATQRLGTLANAPSRLGQAARDYFRRPEKFGLDLEIASVRNEGAIGYSLEFKPGSWRPSDRAWYFALKHPNDPLLDKAQFKASKVRPGALIAAVARGTAESIRQQRALGPRTGGEVLGTWKRVLMQGWRHISSPDWRQSYWAAAATGEPREGWAPLRREVWKVMEKAETAFSSEVGTPASSLNEHLSRDFSFYWNRSAKVPNDAVKKTLAVPQTPYRGFANFSGFAVGTAGSYAGAWLFDRFGGRDISNDTVRRAFDGFGGGMTGVAADALTQRFVSNYLPSLAAKVAPKLQWAAPAAGALSRGLGKVSLGAVGRTLGTFARVAGPAGALLPAAGDIRDAVNNFRNGDSAEGWRSAAKGTIRAGFGAAGAVLGSIFIPIPGVGTVAGAVGFGLIGDWVASKI